MAQFEGGYMEARPSMGQEIGTGSTYNSRPESNTLRALTILQFKKGLESMEDASADTILIDNQETNNLTIVGEVMSVQKQTSFDVYVINDGTGEIQVKKYRNKDTEALTHPVEEEEDILEEHMWVIVHGHHKPMNNDGLVVAFSVRPITDHNEVTYHFARCMQQHLYFTKGPLRSKPQPNPAAGRFSLGNESVQLGSFQSTTAGAVAGGASREDDVVAAIQRVLIQHQELHIDAICTHLEDDFGKRKIRDAVHELANSGQIYVGSSDESYCWSG